MENEEGRKTVRVGFPTNNAKLAGWAYASLELPATEHEIRDAMQRARSEPSIKQDCEVVECSVFPALARNRLMPTTIVELNFLAKRLAGLNEEEEVVLRALTDKIVKKAPEGDTISVKDIINYTYNLDKVPVVCYARTDEDLGRFVIESEHFEELKNLSNEMINLLDKTALGKRFRESEGGVFEGGMYVLTDEYTCEEVYDGKRLPEDIKLLFPFCLEVAKPPKYDISEVEDAGKWIRLPVDKEEVNYLAMKLGENRIEDCVYLGFESSIPQITEEQFGDMQKFDTLNEVARILEGLNWQDEAKLKAILEVEQPKRIEDILQIARDLGEYEMDGNILNSDMYFQEYLSRNLSPKFDRRWLESVSAGYAGKQLMERVGARETRYGFLSVKGGRLYPIVAKYDKRRHLQEEFEVVEVCDKVGLFTNGRVEEKDLPEGIYKYELREDDDGEDFASLEGGVSVNFAGTILLKEELDLGAEDCIKFTDETSPNFLGADTTLQEYLDNTNEEIVRGIEIGGME